MLLYQYFKLDNFFCICVISAYSDDTQWPQRDQLLLQALLLSWSATSLSYFTEFILKEVILSVEIFM